MSRYSGDDGAFSAPQGGGPRIVEEDDVTVCVAIGNTGDVPLTDVTFGDDGLSLVTGGLVVVDGSLDSFDPGDTVLLTGVATANARVRAEITVTATPLNDLGEAVVDRQVSQSRRLTWNPAEPPEPPAPVEPDTVGSDLSDGWGVFTSAGGWALRAVAFLLPFLATVGAIALLVWWRRRRWWSAAEGTAADDAPVRDEASVDSAS